MKTQLLVTSALTISAVASVLVPTDAAQAARCFQDRTGDGQSNGASSQDDGGGTNTNLTCGNNAEATGSAGSTAIGSFAEATADDATALGHNSLASGEESTALGKAAEAIAEGAIAVGIRAKADAVTSIAIGDRTSVNSAAVGGTAIGSNSQITGTGTNSVALGFGSVANAPNTVSVGSNTMVRRIVNVADGIDATDAATVGQVSQQVSEVSQQASQELDDRFFYIDMDFSGASNTDPDSGVEIRNSAAVAGSDTSMAIGAGARATGKSSMAIGSGQVGASKALANFSVALGSTAIVEANAHESVALGVGSVATEEATVSVGRAALQRRIVWVDDGVDEFDAVNVRQLNSAVEAVEQPFLVVNSTPGGLGVTPPTAEGNNAIALGNGVDASGSASIGIGTNAVADNGATIAIGVFASSEGVGGVALGGLSSASADGSIAIGSDSGEGNPFTGANASALNSVALGADAVASAERAVAIGSDSIADAANTVSVGSAGAERRIVNLEAGVDLTDAVNVGQMNDAIGNLEANGSTYVATNSSGDPADASGLGALAIGGDSGQDGDAGGSIASGDYSTAIGPDASATGALSYALGPLAVASGINSTALGAFANADGVSSLALGANSATSANFAMALGQFTSAAHLQSSAIGYGAVTTRANQIVIGQDGTAFGAGGNPTTITLPGLPTSASNAAQSGQVFVVTVDSAGNLGFQADTGNSLSAAPGQTTTSTSSTSVKTVAASSLTLSQTSVDGGAAMAAPADQAIAAAPVAEVAMLDADQTIPEPPAERDFDAGTRSVITPASSRRLAAQSVAPNLAAPALAQVSEEQFSQLTGRVDGLEGRIDELEVTVSNMNFNLAELDQRTSGGIASAMAMGSAPIVPDKNISFTVAAANYRGEQAFAGSITGRLSDSVFLSASLSGNTAEEDIGARVAATFGF